MIYNNDFNCLFEYNIIINDINNLNIIISESNVDYTIIEKFNNILSKIIEFVDKVYLKLRSELQFKQSFLTKNKNLIRVGFELLKDDNDIPSVYKGLNTENFMKDIETISEFQNKVLAHITDGIEEREWLYGLFKLKEIENRMNNKETDHYSKKYSIKGSDVNFFINECTKGLNDKMAILLRIKRRYQKDKVSASNYFYNGPENEFKTNFFVTYSKCITIALNLIKRANSIIIEEYTFHTKYANRCIAAAQKYSKENKNSDSKAVTPVNDAAIIYAESVELLGNIKFI